MSLKIFIEANEVLLCNSNQTDSSPERVMRVKHIECLMQEEAHSSKLHQEPGWYREIISSLCLYRHRDFLFAQTRFKQSFRLCRTRIVQAGRNNAA